MSFHKYLVGADLHSPSQEQVENNSGSTITKLKVVKLNGIGSVYPQIVPVSSLSDSAAGIAQADIATGQTAYIAAYGRLNDVDTSAYTLNDQLFSDASGNLTTTNTGIPVGVVIKIGSTNGIIFLTLYGKGPKGDDGDDGVVERIAVSDVDDPSSELSSQSGSTGDLIALYEDGDPSQCSIYLFDSTITATTNSPFIVNGSGGKWIAIAGKYTQSGVISNGDISAPNLQTVTQVEAEAGTATTTRLWTAERVAQAIAALAAPGAVWGGITGTLSDQTDLQTALNGKLDTPAVGNNKLLATDGSGAVIAAPDTSINALNGLDISLNVDAPNTSGFSDFYFTTASINAADDTPDRGYNLVNNQIQFDTDNQGFDIGTNGTAAGVISNYVAHSGTSNIGDVAFIKNNFAIGNGTDPIDLKGVSYCYGFGNVAANVTVTGPLQGYGFQPTVDEDASFAASNAYIKPFYDACNIECEAPGHISFNASPNLAEIRNNSNYTGLNINPTVTALNGNGSVTGIGVSGNIGSFNLNGSFRGVSVSPTISSGRYVAAFQASMNSVTPYAGAASTLTVQDLTFTFIAVGDNNTYTMAYTSGATAGAEVVSISGTDVSVQIESGVSTATQIKAALDGDTSFSSVITTTITGTASNAQTPFSATPFTSGENAGQVFAADLQGDVRINGPISAGKADLFYNYDLVSGTSNPFTIHSFVTGVAVDANDTITAGDVIGVNTAMLMNVGDNATVSTNLVGLSAMAMPSVVSLGAGSVVDRVSGATCALSLDPGAGGGTISELDICRSVAIPNGVTTVTKLYGFKMDLPFGDPGSTSWGFYESSGIHNYMAGNILIGGTAGSDDTVTNSSVAMEIKSSTKSLVVSRMDTTARNALTAIDGMIIYNTSTDKFQGYANSTWDDLN